MFMMLTTSAVTKIMSNSEIEEEADERSHLADVDDGAGCVEIWETISENRSDD